ncbi:voltage-dependent anion-selective channel-like [Daktulosphaira vitifoliae]|uniref:voltage-dependent anion-selective channel-like n=1 Tax=Daktulosphaira vitifoliae TaxID=58002 RepID=UPI0021AADC44|nr:voltage-dependent anion-selective channel-like [Daktulosphaira vitifoliae]XP_050532766.1 voltage-dependent anion-selective channel-like [Daktulosphaira vitifoliae]
MTPPSFSDLGKDARNVFNNGYVFDVLKLDLKTNQNVEIKAGGTQHLASGAVNANLETKYVINKNKYLLTFVEKWNTNDVMTTEASISGLLPGVKLVADGTFDRKKQSKAVKVKSEFKNDYVSVNLDTEFRGLKPLINASGVAAYNGWLAGYNVKYNTNDNELQSNNLALSYIAKKFVFTTTVNDCKVFGGSIFQKLCDKTDLGLQVSWSSESNDSSLAIGTQYQLNSDVKLRAKINNKSQLCLGSGIKVKEGVTLTLASMFECRTFNQGGHKFGIGLELAL